MRKSSLLYVAVALLMTQPCWAQNAVHALPFELIGNHIFIQLRVNGSPPLDFIFDTGASTTVVHDATARMLELPEDLHAMATGTAGEVPVVMSEDVSLELQGLPLQHLHVIQAPLEHLGRYIGRPIDGIIGYELLSRYIVQLDFDRHRLMLYEFQAPPNFPEEGGQRLAFDLHLNLPMVYTRLIGPGGHAYEGHFLVDTGAGSALILNAPFVSREDLIELAPSCYPNRSYGLSNQTAESCIGRVEAFFWGDHEFANLPAKFSMAYQGVEAQDLFIGIIGNELLRKFNLTFDYQRQLIHFAPSLDYPHPFAVNCSGLKLQLDEQFRHVEVLDVILDSPASQAGFRRGDIIHEINGRSVHELSLPELQAHLQQAGTQVELVIQRGRYILNKILRLKPLI